MRQPLRYRFGKQKGDVHTGLAEILRVEIYDALKELSEYDPAKFEAANEEYLARIGVAKPEAQADRNGPFSPSGPELEKRAVNPEILRDLGLISSLLTPDLADGGWGWCFFEL